MYKPKEIEKGDYVITKGGEIYLVVNTQVNSDDTLLVAKDYYSDRMATFGKNLIRKKIKPCKHLYILTRDVGKLKKGSYIKPNIYGQVFLLDNKGLVEIPKTSKLLKRVSSVPTDNIKIYTSEKSFNHWENTLRNQLQGRTEADNVPL